MIEIYAPKGEAEFIRLTREHYSLRFDDYTSTTAYLTQIKTLEERIRNVNVILDDDKQTLLCLGITLPENLQYFIKIWAMTSGITADKARNMLLEEERRIKTSEQDLGMAFAGIRTRTPSRKALENAGSGSESACPKCGKRYKPEQYWTLHLELVPE